MKRFILMLTAVALLSPMAVAADRRAKNRAEVLSRGRGYYKEVFMDGGLNLTSRHYLPAAKFLGVNMEYFASAKKPSQKDTVRQRNIFCGSEKDANGWLLYPDGAPRFRMIYVNGGKSRLHALSLTEQGRKRIGEYYNAGGSYVGTCAGAYLASLSNVSTNGQLRNKGTYLNLWPGLTRFTQLRKSFTGMRIERRSPLMRYFDFGGDGMVDSVRHNGGCIAYYDASYPLPKGTELLSSYIYDDDRRVKINGKMSAWAYKTNEQSGRVIMCGSHPESIARGERLEYMSAMMLYAMDGNPAPTIKGVLRKGELREMNKRTEDQDPAYTRIGDRQYHHFAVDVPKKCRRMIIMLDGYEGMRRYDLTLCAKRGEMAYHDNTLLKNVARGTKKRLVVDAPKSGRWYISVFCETTVLSSTGKYGTSYSGRVGVLNGVPYSIRVEYE